MNWCKKCYHSDANFVGWFSVIMRNGYLNEVKREKRYCVTDDCSVLDECCCCDNSFDFRKLQTIIASLPNDLYFVLRLYVSGYRYCEIATMLSLPLGTVKSRIHAARRSLMAVLERCCIRYVAVTLDGVLLCTSMQFLAPDFEL